MIKKSLISGFLIISFFPAFLTAQSTFDKRFYLVDSLDEAGIVPQEKMLIDSCLNVFHQAKHDTEKVAAINFLVEELWNDNVWPKYNFWLYDFLSEKLKDTTDTKPQEKDFYLKYYSAVLNNTGYYFKTHDQLNKAIEFYNKSLKIDKLRNDKQSMALTYNNIAVIYLSLGKIEDALNYLSQALKSYESIDYKEGMSLVYNNIGAIYQKQNDYQNAKKFYLKSIQIDSALKRIKPLISTYSNLGLITLEEKDTLNAKKIFSKALSFADETSYLQGKALVLNNLGLCYLSDPPKDSALICFKKAKTLYEQTNNPSRVSYCQIHIAEFFLKKQQLALAQMYADSAYTIAKQIGFPELIEKSAGVLRKAAVLNENWQTAYKMLEEEFLMHDSLLNEKTKKSTELQLAQYQYEKQKAIEQKEHEKKLEIARKEKEKQQIITYFASSGLLAVLIFLWYLYTRFKIIRKQKEQISLQKEELEKVYTSLEEHHKEIQDSIVYSKRIQDIILPEKELLNTHLHSGFILFQPKDVVSGDFYWMEVFNNNVFFAAADCTGHGVPGAMVSVVCSNTLTKALVEEKIDAPAEILNRSRELVIQRFSKNNKTVRDGMDISLCKYNKETHELEWAGANNPLWIFRKGETPLTDNGSPLQPKMQENGVFGYEIKADNQPIGYYEAAKPFTAHKISIQPGDKIYIFSDGYIDQFGGPKGKKFKSKNLFKLLLKNYHESVSRQKEILQKNLKSWMKDDKYLQVDDICIFGVEIV